MRMLSLLSLVGVLVATPVSADPPPLATPTAHWRSLSAHSFNSVNRPGNNSYRVVGRGNVTGSGNLPNRAYVFWTLVYPDGSRATGTADGEVSAVYDAGAAPAFTGSWYFELRYWDVPVGTIFEASVTVVYEWDDQSENSASTTTQSVRFDL